MHWFYKKETGDRVDFHTYRDVTYAINKKMMSELLDKQLAWYLPHTMGKLVVIKNNKKTLANYEAPIDYNKSKKLGMSIKHENEHTNGYIYKFIWKKDGIVKVRGQKLYAFQVCRNAKRRLAKILKDPERTFDYVKRT